MEAATSEEQELQVAEEAVDENEVTTEEELGGPGDVKKSKKKKKKKKKKSHSDASGGSSSDEGSGHEKPADKQEKQEAERRYQKALDAAKHSEDMWVLLGNANIHDAKARKLFEALKSNSSITSINLSANHIGEEGVQALAEVLGEGGCSELINLDLRGNSLSAAADELLVGLRRKRKQLVITTGPLPDESASAAAAADSSSSSSKPGGSRGGRSRSAGGRMAAAQQRQQQQQEQQRDGQNLKDLKHSAMFKRYFQTEEDEGTGSSEEDEAEPVDEQPPPAEVWAQVSELLPGGVGSIPALAEALLAVSRALDAEMGLMPALEDKASLEDFRPHFRAVLEQLGLLGRVMALEPEHKISQASSSTPKPAVGSHRVWACAILHMLLLHNNPIIDRAVHEAHLLPAALALALGHSHCSAVQCRAAEMVRSSLQSSVQELWQGLFQDGFGLGISRQQVFGSSNSNSSSGGDQEGGSSSAAELIPPLHKCLVQLAGAAVPQPMGQRSCVLGFVAEVANTLLQSSDPSQPQCHCGALAALLDSDDEWQSSIDPAGAIHSLLQEQAGQLCGPPPPRPPPSESGEDSLEPSLGMSGSQLIALLSRMGDLST